MCLTHNVYLGLCLHMLRFFSLSNLQCAFQDGTSKICCFKSHYFIGDDNQNIKLCVDLTGITEAAMTGCIVTPAEEPVLVGDALDIAIPVLSRPGADASDPNK
jgi:hypothetical protein